MSGFGKAFGSILLFFMTILSYSPLKGELVNLAGNATLTNAGVVMMNTIFGLIWILLAVFWLGLAIIYALK